MAEIKYLGSAALAQIAAEVKAGDKAVDDKIGVQKADGVAATGLYKYVDDSVAAVDSTTANKLSIEEAAGAGDVLKSYTFYQGVVAEDTDETKAAKKIATINLAKDLVVTSGEVVVDPSGQPAGTYLKLTIANQTDPVYINVADLCDVYASGSTTGDKVVVAVDADTNKITASITAGTIAKADLVEAVSDEITAATTAIGKASKAESSEGAGDGEAATGIYARIEALEGAGGLDTHTAITAQEVINIFHPAP